MAEHDAKSVFDPLDEVEEARLDSAADAEIEAGQFVPHNRVMEWLRSWGKPNELPCPKPEPR
jgi:predicted transcriptional regulator